MLLLQLEILYLAQLPGLKHEATDTIVTIIILVIINLLSLKFKKLMIFVGIQYFFVGLMLCASIIITGRVTPEGWWAQMWDSVDLYIRAIPALGLLLLCWWASDFLMRE